MNKPKEIIGNKNSENSEVEKGNNSFKTVLKKIAYCVGIFILFTLWMWPFGIIIGIWLAHYEWFEKDDIW